jgi:hypothetical protein
MSYILKKIEKKIYVNNNLKKDFLSSIILYILNFYYLNFIINNNKKINVLLLLNMYCIESGLIKKKIEKIK